LRLEGPEDSGENGGSEGFGDEEISDSEDYEEDEVTPTSTATASVPEFSVLNAPAHVDSSATESENIGRTAMPIGKSRGNGTVIGHKRDDLADFDENKTIVFSGRKKQCLQMPLQN
jgi:hypothetical protein